MRGIVFPIATCSTTFSSNNPSWHGCISDASLRCLKQLLRDILKRADLQILETSPLRYTKM